MHYVDICWIVVGVLLTSIYFVLGFGVSRMVYKIKQRDVSLVDVVLWPIVVVAFASIGDIN